MDWHIIHCNSKHNTSFTLPLRILYGHLRDLSLRSISSTLVRHLYLLTLRTFCPALYAYTSIISSSPGSHLWLDVGDMSQVPARYHVGS
jgi:hypothetical protein